MSGKHGFDHRHLHVHGTSPLHRLAPEAKLAGLLAFVIVVALTPRQWIAAFALDAAIATALVVVARLPPRLVIARLTAITPFVAFALFLPFLGDGDTIDIASFSLSVDGLWASWNILAKAGLGALASILVTATTPIPDLLSGLSRLRIPTAIVGILGFMFRYLDLVVDDLTRMRRAMAARCYNPRWLWQSRPIASSAGALFVRTYERGERVHHAMAARGYAGRMPDLDRRAGTHYDWALAAAPALVAVVGVAALALA